MIPGLNSFFDDLPKGAFRPRCCFGFFFMPPIESLGLACFPGLHRGNFTDHTRAKAQKRVQNGIAPSCGEEVALFSGLTYLSAWAKKKNGAYWPGGGRPRILFNGDGQSKTSLSLLMLLHRVGMEQRERSSENIFPGQISNRSRDPPPWE